MIVNVKRIDKTIPLPVYQTPGSVGFDLSARNPVSIEPETSQTIPLNVIVEVPPGHLMFITPRSSLFRRHNLLIPNSPGIIDTDFCGPEDECLVNVYNAGQHTVVISRGERIAQGIIVPVIIAEWNEVDGVKENSRGGFGSTG